MQGGLGAASAPRHGHPRSCRRIIKEIKANHEAQTPEALARNCVLIRELNTNISAVRGPGPGVSLGAGALLYCSSTLYFEYLAKHAAVWQHILPK